MPEELRQQVPVIQDVLEAMGITIVKRQGFEADDILGTIAKMAEAEGKEVTLVSGDRDLLQLATKNIKISIPKTKKGGSEVEEYHTEDVIEKYGVTPVQIIDMKGLMGDTADNIPGVAGVGEKTAVKILKAFPSVEEAYEHIEEVEPKRARELLRAGKDMAFLSKKLATIKTDCELDYSIKDAKLENIFTSEAFEWIKKLELKSLVKKFDSEAMNKAVERPKNFKYLKKKIEVKRFADRAYKGCTWRLLEYHFLAMSGQFRCYRKRKIRKKRQDRWHLYLMIYQQFLLKMRVTAQMNICFWDLV